MRLWSQKLRCEELFSLNVICEFELFLFCVCVFTIVSLHIQRELYIDCVCFCGFHRLRFKLEEVRGLLLLLL